MFADVEDNVVTRLTAKLAALDSKPKVFTAANLTGIKDKSQGGASVYVAYNGISGITPLAANPAVVTVSHEFMVWTVTRSASRHGSQEGTRELADPIMVAVLQALCGWRHTTGAAPLELAETPGPAYEEGFGYFPLVFTLKQQIRGNPN